MRRKDIGIILAVVFFSAVLSILVSRVLFAKPQSKQQQVEVVQPISADFSEPDKRYFGPSAVDPTQSIQIGNNSNPDPFRSTTLDPAQSAAGR